MNPTVLRIKNIFHDPACEHGPHDPNAIYVFTLVDPDGTCKELGQVMLSRLQPLMRIFGHSDPALLIGLTLIPPSMLREGEMALGHVIKRTEAAGNTTLTYEDIYQIAIDALAEMRVPDFEAYPAGVYRQAIENLCISDSLFERFCEEITRKSGGLVTIYEVDEDTFNLVRIQPAMRFMLIEGPGSALKVVIHPLMTFMEDVVKKDVG